MQRDPDAVSELAEPAEPISADAIDRYVAGQSNAVEAEQVRAYLATHSGVGRYHQALQRYLTSGIDRATVDPRTAFDRWQAELVSRPVRGRRLAERAQYSRFLAGRARVGLGLVVLAAVSFIVVLARPWAGRFSAQRRLTPAVARSYSTAWGQTATVTLHDGSRVVLAPHTTLTLYQGFGTQNRDVMVRGEAYFDVATAAGIPFIVQTSTGATARVLGTTFDVTAYPKSRIVHIVVLSGRVLAMPTHGAAVAVVSGLAAQVSDSVATTTAAAYTNWTSGALVFDKRPVPEVLNTLSQWYGMQFQLADTTLANVLLTARFSTRSSSEVMELLKTVLHVTLTFDRAGDPTIVTLHPQSRRNVHTDTASYIRDVHTTLSTAREVGR